MGVYSATQVVNSALDWLISKASYEVEISKTSSYNYLNRVVV